MNVLISCAGGFSSSLVVTNLRKAAAAHGIPINAWAIHCADIDENIIKADILLIAPQIQYEAAEFEKKAQAQGIPFAQISAPDYGYCNGENILNMILKLLKK